MLHEILPMSFLVVKAGGRALVGVGEKKELKNALEVLPESLHERASFFAGSEEEIFFLENEFKK